MILQSI